MFGCRCWETVGDDPEEPREYRCLGHNQWNFCHGGYGSVSYHQRQFSLHLAREAEAALRVGAMQTSSCHLGGICPLEVQGVYSVNIYYGVGVGGRGLAMIAVWFIIALWSEVVCNIIFMLNNFAWTLSFWLFACSHQVFKYIYIFFFVCWENRLVKLSKCAESSTEICSWALSFLYLPVWFRIDGMYLWLCHSIFSL